MQERAQNPKRTKQGSRSLDSLAKKGAKRACTVSRLRSLKLQERQFLFDLLC